MPIKIFKVEEERVCTLNVSGILDYSTMNRFIEEVRTIKDGTQRVIVNFTELEFIDSTGIGSIINLVHEANERNFIVELDGVSDGKKELFQMIGVYEILDAIQMEA